MSWKKINWQRFDLAKYDNYWQQRQKLLAEKKAADKEIPQANGSTITVRDFRKYREIDARLEALDSEYNRYFQSCLEE